MATRHVSPQISWLRQAHVAVELALAHHPLCHYFSSDVARWRNLRFCLGCVAAIPAFVVGLVAAWAGIAAGFPAATACMIGLSLGVPQAVSYFRRRGRSARVATKIVGGLGLGFLVSGLLLLPASALVIFLAFAVLSLAFLGFQLLRLRKILATCRACPWKMDWENCPGFRPRTERESQPFTIAD